MMGDVAKLMDWLQSHPGFAWTPIAFVIVIAVVLVFEVVKALLPQAIKGAASDARVASKDRRLRRGVEDGLRRLCVAGRNVNWVSALPALAKFEFRIPLTEVFVAPGLSISQDGARAAPLNFQDFLSSSRFSCVTGAPGGGKSTLLSFTAIAFAEERAEQVLGVRENRIPLCFDCKELPTDELPPASQLFARLLARRGVEIQPAHLDTLLRQGRCAIFIDGLDEYGAPPERRRLLQWLQGVFAVSDKNRVLITCRDTEWDECGLPNIQRARITPFSVTDARQLVGRWQEALLRPTPKSPTDEAAIQARLGALSGELDGEFEFLCSNPMLLTLAVILLSLEAPLPRKRSHILASFVMAMLGDWKAVKTSLGRPAAPHPDYAPLKRLALHSLQSARGSSGVVDENDLELEALLLAPGDERSAPAWLARIAAETGLIQKLDGDAWGFANRRILEFLAATELATSRSKWMAYWNDPKWKDIVLFLPEILPDKDRHLDWLTDQGPPASDMHALFLMGSLLEIEDTTAERRSRAFEQVRAYVQARVRRDDPIDEDLAKRFLKASPERTRGWISAELEEMAEGASRGELVLTALRVGNLPAAQALAMCFGRLDRQLQAQLAQLTPTFRQPVQRTLLPALLQCDLVAEHPAVLSKCGVEMLDELIGFARQSPAGAVQQAAIAAIAEFAHPRAFAALDDLRSDRRLQALAGPALERNLTVIGEATSGRDLSAMVRWRETFYQRYAKRVLDLVIATLTLVLFLPLILTISLLIKLESNGPVFFRMARVGRNGDVIGVVKFRTTQPSADEYVVAQAARADPRITSVGRFLRRAGLDELPALFNILLGDLALVGPRPVPRDTFEAWQDHGYWLGVLARQRLRPGLISLSSIRYRNSASVSAEWESAGDVDYMLNCSFALDLRVIGNAIRLSFYPSSSY